jgi:two-component system sensor histidine kinase YcbA
LESEIALEIIKVHGNRLKHTLIVAFCVAFASLFHFDMFVEGFIITLSVILLPIFLMNYQELNPIKTSLIAGIVSPVFREIIVYLQMGDLQRSLYLVMPDIVFYSTYGVLYYLFYYHKSNKDYTRFFLTAFACDFLSNIVELSVRTDFVGINSRVMKGLIIIALTRSVIALMATVFLQNYKSFLIREEHEQRYRKLMLLASSFKSEIYYMKKNIMEIEDITKKAFRAYRIIEEQNYLCELKMLALDISKDIHEIKKDYIRVIKGLEEISISKFDISAMDLKDIIQILEGDTNEQIRLEKRDIVFHADVKSNFSIKEHFYLMSILKNLISNSLESVSDWKSGLIELKVFKSEEDYVFTVSDNGKGIKQSDIKFIFNPGFSTKFDEETGDICRGVGLTLVKDLVEDIFSGNISVQSSRNSFTVFTIKIPAASFCPTVCNDEP